MRKKLLMLMTTALISVPTLSMAKPSSSYSRSSGSMGSSISRSSPTISRSVSSYGSSSLSSRSSMERTGSSAFDKWSARSSRSNDTPSRSIAQSNSDYIKRSEPRPTQEAQGSTSYHQHYNSSSGNSDSGTSSFFGSLAGSYIGSRLANADNHNSGDHYHPPQNTNNDYDIEESSPSQVAPSVSSSTSGQEANHQSGLWKILFFLLLLSVAGGAGTWLYYNNTKKDDHKKNDHKKKNTDNDDFMIGQSLTIDSSLLMNDPSSTFCPLHFEAENVGRVTIVGVSKIDNQYRLYLDENQDEFVSVVNEHGVPAESIFYSYIDTYPLASEDDVDKWVGNNGMIGSPTITTRDNVRWMRDSFQNVDNWIEPTDYIEKIKYLDNKIKIRGLSCLYYRDTGFSSAFPNREYLFVSLVRMIKDGNAISYVKMWAGVEIPVSSLEFVK